MSENGNSTRPALPEAPAGATLKAALRGYEILFTLRGHSGRERAELRPSTPTKPATATKPAQRAGRKS